MAPHSSILAWENPMDRGAWCTTVYGVAGSDAAEQLSMHTHVMKQIFFIPIYCMRAQGPVAQIPLPESSWASLSRLFEA